MKHCDPCCRLFRLRHLKRAISEIEVVKVLLHKIGKEFRLHILIVLLKVLWWVLHLLYLISILEDILLDTVPMHVEEEVKLLIQGLIHQLLAKLLRVEYGGVQNFRRVVPFSIEVTGRQGAAVVSINHTVHVEHRH